jgi:DNA polymerase I-like protein with 3'-5' exonuclease and polymerase domains
MMNWVRISDRRLCNSRSVFEVREDSVEPVIAKIAQVMEEVVSMLVEFPVKV